jgi:hypothetical protein
VCNKFYPLELKKGNFKLWLKIAEILQKSFNNRLTNTVSEFYHYNDCEDVGSYRVIINIMYLFYITFYLLLHAV